MKNGILYSTRFWVSILFLFIVSCDKNEDPIINDDGKYDGQPCPSSPTVDWGGHIYSTVQLGTQCWMRENLNIGMMIEGDKEMTDDNIIEKYCYENDTNNCKIYGGLYQWNELMQYNNNLNNQGICPPGWRISTLSDWTSLETYLGGGNSMGGKLKESGLDHWLEPNEGATNSSGFTSLPGGIRNASGSFENLGEASEYWNSDEWKSDRAQNTGLYYNSAAAGYGVRNKTFGLSVRCIKQ
jgi:uncharacterized protein (TIGR02145 family)